MKPSAGLEEVSGVTDFSKLIEKQLRLLELKRDLERTGERPAPVVVDGVPYGPCLLLSRECGSTGNAVAERVADRLHWRLFDSAIVEAIAQRAHVRNQLVESVDEHIRARWQRLLHPLRERAGLRPDAYLYYLHEIILTLGHQGDAVIIGRGAQFLLPKPCALRLRMVEPMESRTRRIAQLHQLTLEQARDTIRSCEDQRVTFIRNVFHQDTTSPLNYDLVLNTEALSVEAVTELVLTALREKLGVELEALPCGK